MLIIFVNLDSSINNRDIRKTVSAAETDILEEETSTKKDEGIREDNGCRYFYKIVSILGYLKIQKQEALQLSRLLWILKPEIGQGGHRILFSFGVMFLI